MSFIVHNKMQVKPSLIQHSLSKEALSPQLWQRAVEAEMWLLKGLTGRDVAAHRLVNNATAGI